MEEKSQEPIEVESDDWLATCAIYGEEVTTIKPLERGFCGCIRISMSTEYTAFFRSIRDKEGHFRFFKLAKQPQLLLTFTYISHENDQHDIENLTSATPTSVKIEWLVYPEEWSDEYKASFLANMCEESNRILLEQALSFDVCEYCEHHAIIKYDPWPIFHREDPFRMIRLPDITDSLYHVNHGALMHPHQEARKLPPSANRGNVIDATMLVKRKRPASVEAYARQALIDEWKQLYTTECPICFDTKAYADGVVLPCHHFACEECLASLLHFKVTELSMYRTNPFMCPVVDCRHALPIIGFVKKYLPTNEMDMVRKWIKDMKYPPCFSLDRCLRTKTCGAFESMRRVTKDSTNIYCDQCNKHWCELCLKRLNEDGTDDQEGSHKERCQDTIAWTFCKRYLAASDNQKQACEVRYPWIVSYAHAREHDGDAMTWILQNGQVCPTCSNGVERIEGCFHMQCPTCATHFCYECGDELFPPYYGTHHCWERTLLQL
jgi:RING-type zinc-finger/IBR domain, a half RING-finger domain